MWGSEAELGLSGVHKFYRPLPGFDFPRRPRRLYLASSALRGARCVALRGVPSEKRAFPGFATRNRCTKRCFDMQSHDSDDDFQAVGYGSPGFHGSPEGFQPELHTATGSDNPSSSHPGSEPDDNSSSLDGEGSDDSDFVASPRRRRIRARRGRASRVARCAPVQLISFEERT